VLSNPSLILTRLRTGRATTSELAALIDGDRDDVSRAVAHLRDRGKVIASYRVADEFGSKDEAAYVLAYDPDHPTDRYCVVPGCHKKLCHGNPGYSTTGLGPLCYWHRDAVESFETSALLQRLAEEDPEVEQMVIAEVMAG
jgi:hypothetical protein